MLAGARKSRASHMRRSVAKSGIRKTNDGGQKKIRASRAETKIATADTATPAQPLPNTAADISKSAIQPTSTPLPTTNTPVPAPAQPEGHNSDPSSTTVDDKIAIIERLKSKNIIQQTPIHSTNDLKQAILINNKRSSWREVGGESGGQSGHNSDPSLPENSDRTTEIDDINIVKTENLTKGIIKSSKSHHNKHSNKNNNSDIIDADRDCSFHTNSSGSEHYIDPTTADNATTTTAVEGGGAAGGGGGGKARTPLSSYANKEDMWEFQSGVNLKEKRNLLEQQQGGRPNTHLIITSNTTSSHALEGGGVDIMTEEETVGPYHESFKSTAESHIDEAVAADDGLGPLLVAGSTSTAVVEEHQKHVITISNSTGPTVTKVKFPHIIIPPIIEQPPTDTTTAVVKGGDIQKQPQPTNNSTTTTTAAAAAAAAAPDGSNLQGATNAQEGQHVVEGEEEEEEYYDDDDEYYGDTEEEEPLDDDYDAYEADDNITSPFDTTTTDVDNNRLIVAHIAPDIIPYKNTANICIRNIFTIITNKHTDIREYTWGNINIYDINYSELRRLQKVIFETNIQIKTLYDETRIKSINLFKDVSDYRVYLRKPTTHMPLHESTTAIPPPRLVYIVYVIMHIGVLISI